MIDRLEPRRLLATFTVTGLGDDGPGTLRDAIERANARPGPDAIAFDLPGEGPHVIAPGSPLPSITDAVVIDGTTQPGSRPNAAAEGTDALIPVAIDGALAGEAAGLRVEATGSVIRGLAIRRFSGEGIVLAGDGNRVEGSVIGARDDPSEGNGVGVRVFKGDRNTIGGADPSARNLISGNRGPGVDLVSVQSGRFFFDLALDNAIRGNLIGTDASGLGPMGNEGPGVSANFGSFFGGSGSGNVIGGVEPGAGNAIAFNRGAGVLGRFAVLSNSIFENEGMGIDLGEFSFPGAPPWIPNGNQVPLLISAEAGPEGTRVQGVLIGQPDRAYRLEVFADEGDPSGFGEGRFLLGSAEVTTDTAGNAVYDVTVPGTPPEGTVVSATWTHPEFGTSAFSPTPAIFLASADVAVEAGFDVLEARSGDEVTFTAVVRNNGPGEATDARLTIAIPTYASSSPPNFPDPGSILSASVSRGTIGIEAANLVAHLGTLEPGAVVEATVRIRVPNFEAEGAIPFGPPRLTTFLRAGSGSLDLFPSQPISPSMVVDRGQLAVDRSVSPGVVQVGETAAITFSIRNEGPAPAQQVVFNQPFLPFGLELVSIAPDRGTVGPDGMTFNLGTLQPGETASVTLVVRPAMPGVFSMNALITSPNSGFPTMGLDSMLRVQGPATGSGLISLSLPDLPRRALRRVAVQIIQTVDPALAADPGTYRVEVLGPGGRPRAVPVRSVSYDPGSLTATIETSRPLPVGRTIRVTAIADGLIGLDGLPIDGDGDFLPGGDFVGLIDVGHTVRYRDPDGDRVALALHGGLIELTRGVDGQVRSLRLLTAGRRATLLGRIRQADGGDGLVAPPPYTVEGRTTEVRDRLPGSFLRPVPF